VGGCGRWEGRKCRILSGWGRGKRRVREVYVEDNVRGRNVVEGWERGFSDGRFGNGMEFWRGW
jgi:hypothetical protein